MGQEPRSYARRISDKTRGFLCKLLPPSLRNKPVLQAQLTRWLLLGLLLRLVFMPFAAHNDYLSEHWRAEQVAFGGVVYPTRLELVSHYLDALTLRLFAPLIPEHARLFWSPSAEQMPFPNAGPLEYAQFAAYPLVNRALFLTKIPYLVFDLIAAWVLLLLFSDPGQSVRAFKYWLLNPATVYAVYIFGRYEVYALAAILISMLLLYRQHRNWGAIVLGLGVLMRASSLLLVPVYAMAAARSWPQRLKVTILALLPMAASILLIEGWLGWSPAFTSERQSWLLQILLTPIGGIWWYPYVMGYVLTIMAFHFGLNGLPPLKRYALSGLSVYLLIFIFTHHSPAYYAWIMPFLVWIIGENAVFGRYFWWQFVAWSFFWLMATDMGVFTPYLFSPVSAYMQEIHLTPFLLARFASIGLERDHMVYIGRSILAAVSIWILVAAIRSTAPRNAKIGPLETT